MKFNPIVKRDLTVGSRSTRLTALIVAMNAVLLGVDLLALFGRLAAFRLASAADLRSVLYIYCIAAGVIFLYVLFLFPALTVGSITAERDSGTMDLMLASGLNPHRIVLGKFLSNLFSALVLLATFLPGLVLPLIFGGVEMTSCILLLLLFIPTAVEMLCIGLYASARTRSGSSAAFEAYALVLGITLIPVAVTVLFRQFSGSGDNPSAFLLLLSPVTPAVRLLAEQVGEMALLESVYRWLKVPAALTEGRTLITAGIIVQAAFAVHCFLLAAAKMVPGRQKRSGRKGKQLQSEEKCVE